jgi:hypothetical protein
VKVRRLGWNECGLRNYPEGGRKEIVDELTLRSPNPRRSSPASSSALGMRALPRPPENLGFRTSCE